MTLNNEAMTLEQNRNLISNEDRWFFGFVLIHEVMAKSPGCFVSLWAFWAFDLFRVCFGNLSGKVSNH